MLNKVAKAKEASTDVGNTPIAPAYDALLDESKRLAVINVHEAKTIADLIRALILTFEKVLGHDVETAVQNTEKYLAIWPENFTAFKNVQSLKHELTVSDLKAH